jgi:hypothetical protein
VAVPSLTNLALFKCDINMLDKEHPKGRKNMISIDMPNTSFNELCIKHLQGKSNRRVFYSRLELNGVTSYYVFDENRRREFFYGGDFLIHALNNTATDCEILKIKCKSIKTLI